MPRFVLLEHDHPFLHWDLMFECGGVLRTWRLDRIPAEAGIIRAEPLPDHRLAYLDYEGPVSGNRGIVKRVDAGEFALDDSGAAVTSQSPVIECQLAGTLLRGAAKVCSDSGTLEWRPVSPDVAT